MIEVAAERQNQLSAYSLTRSDDFDTEADFECPIFNSFYDPGRADAILKMTNFTPSEFRSLYGSVKHVLTHWNAKCGLRSQYKPIDFFFICLPTMKDGELWDQLGNIFRIKGSTFMNLILKL